MRVLVAASKYLPEYTGAAFRLHELYRSLRDQSPDWNIQVVCGGIERADRADYQHDGIAVHRVRSRAPQSRTRAGRAWRAWLDANETWRWLNTVSCDVIHTIGTSTVVATAIHFARLKKIPFIVELVTPGAPPDQGMPLLGRAWRPDMNRGGVIVAISKPIVEECRARGYIQNVWGRPNPVDTARFFPEHERRNHYRAQISSYGPDDAVIVAVAKFMPRKNQIFLIDVLAKLDKKFKLILAGPLIADGALAARDADYFKALQSKIREHGVGERVHLVTDFVQSDLYIKAADIFAMPIIEEGFGTPVLEAQACGIPVIANSNVPAFHPHIDEGRTGFFRPLEVNAWSDAVMASMLLQREALDHHAREIAERFSFMATRDTYRRVLERVKTISPNELLDVSQVVGAGPRF